MNKKIRNGYLIILIMLPLILKLVLAFIIPAQDDIIMFEWVTGNLLAGHNPYLAEDNGLYKLVYGPMFYLLSIINGKIAILTGLPLQFVFKIFPILAEACIAVILFLILNKKYSIKKSFFWALIFALNPATLSISAIHGQFDSLPILTLALAYYFFENSSSKVRVILPAICLGIGASFKYFFPLLIAFMLFFKYKRIKEKLNFTIITITTMFITYIPHIVTSNFFRALKAQLFFSPHINWSIAKIFLLFNRINLSPKFIPIMEGILGSYGKFILASILILTVITYSKVKSLKNSFKVTFYCFYTFSLFMNPQYLTWIIPFLFMEINLKEILYLIPSTAHIYFLYIINLIGVGIGVVIGNNPLFSALSFIFGILTWIFSLYMYFIYMKRCY